MATILVLNGDQTTATMLTEFLHWQGHRAIVADSVAEADGWVQSGAVDLLVTERVIPFPTGEAVPEALGPSCRVARVPVLVWTADVLEEHRTAVLATGAHFLAQPTPMEALGEVVNELLKERLSLQAESSDAASLADPTHQTA